MLIAGSIIIGSIIVALAHLYGVERNSRDYDKMAARYEKAALEYLKAQSK